MKKMASILLTVVLLVGCMPLAFGAGTTTEAPSYLIPSVFVERYNALIDVLAQLYAESLGEEGVMILNDEYTMTQIDISGSLAYYGTAKWDIEAGFLYPDGVTPDTDQPAQLMNFAIKAETPEGAAQFASFIFRMIISYEYLEDETLQSQLDEWFASVQDPTWVMNVPGYTLNAFFTNGTTQYAVLPADTSYTDGLQGGQTVTDEFTEIHCEQDGFTTMKPKETNDEYKNTRGYMGFRVYLDVPGYPPYIIIHRRPMEGKFNNPTNYLNNTYREFLENKYEANGLSVGTNPAKKWEVGGKELIGARYYLKDKSSETIQLQLIEIRELGDVEYTAMFDPADEEMVMKALDAAVANYKEDEAK